MSDVPVPIVLTIAGSDCSGGAGIQADLKTIGALGAYGASVITALTAQNTLGVRAVHSPPADFLRAQLHAVFEDLDIRAVKIGMIGEAQSVRVVAEVLSHRKNIPIVLDPVMVATSGARLIDADAETVLTSQLLPLADLLTPNLLEAAALTGDPIASTRPDVERQARKLVEMGAKAVLIKGGHGEGETMADCFFDGQSCHWFESARVDTKNVHGTGCTLSSAIASYLARGETLVNAVRLSKDYVTAALRHADTLKVGEGPGPLHHLFNVSS